MKVLHDLVLIQPISEDKSVFTKPESSKETPSSGLVITTGPDTPSSLRGKNVIYRRWMGDAVSFDDKEYIVVRFEDVLITDYKVKKNV